MRQVSKPALSSGPPRVQEVVRVPLPTPDGVFDARAFECPTGHVYVALCRGGLDGSDAVLCRLHSECLTGDALTSLRCDCGQQLRLALRTIAAEGCGVLIYATGHEGRGIGLVNKLRSYVEQDNGADTVDANVRLGLPVDARDYADAADVLRILGVRSIQLLSNNPRKAEGLRDAGIEVSSVRPLPTAPHTRNGHYLRTKETRLGHVRPAGPLVEEISPGQLPTAIASDTLPEPGSTRTTAPAASSVIHSEPSPAAIAVGLEPTGIRLVTSPLLQLRIFFEEARPISIASKLLMSNVCFQSFVRK